ncbi:2645_t:CDS:10, partial [Gigaspora margarita]
MVLQFDLVLKSHFIVTIVIAGIGWIILLGAVGAITSLFDRYSFISTSSGLMAALWLYILSLLILSFISNCFFAYRVGPILSAEGKALTAEEDSPLVKAINETYNNINFNISPTNNNNPVGTRFVPQPSPMYTSDVRSNQLSVVISPMETSSPIQANKTMYLAQAPMQSQYSTPVLPSTSTQAPMQSQYSTPVLPSTSTQAPMQSQYSTAVLPSTSTQVQQVAYNQNSTSIPQSIYIGNELNSNTITDDDYKYKAKAIYDYRGSPEDRTELSFVKGDDLDIASKEGKWWHARKADGTTGIAPNRGSPEDRTELSFAKGEYFDIANKDCKWWNAKKADGTTGIVPSNYMQIIETRIYDGYKYKAMKLYNYRGRPEYRTELSFAKGEYLDIASKKGSWWKARKADVPFVKPFINYEQNEQNFRVDVNPFKDFNNFNQIYEHNEQNSDSIVNKITGNPFNINYEQKEQNSDTRVHDGYKYKAKALSDYYGSPEDPTELSFVKGEYLDIANKEFKWWNARKADGTT